MTAYAVCFGIIAPAFVSEVAGAALHGLILLGLFAIAYGFLTDSELGWKPVLTMPAHLALAAMLLLPLLFPLLVMLVGRPSR